MKMKIAGTTLRGRRFNAEAHLTLARSTWRCALCDRTMVAGSDYYRVNAFMSHKVCVPCAVEAAA